MKPWGEREIDREEDGTEQKTEELGHTNNKENYFLTHNLLLSPENRCRSINIPLNTSYGF